MKSAKGSAILFLIIIILVLALVVVSIFAVYLYIKQNPQAGKNLTLGNDILTKLNISKVETPKLPSGASVSDKLTRITDDLGLYEVTEGSTPGVYYTAGVFKEGKYKGYVRVVGVNLPEGPGFPAPEIFATKDFKEYVLDGDVVLAKKYTSDNEWRNPFLGKNKNKVKAVDDLSWYQPQVIKLDETFAMYRSSVPIESVKVEKTKEGYDEYEWVVVTDFSDYRSLKGTNSDLKFLWPKPWVNPNKADLNVAEKKFEMTRETYEDGSSGVTVADPIGLAFLYNLTTNKAIEDYNKNKYSEDYVPSPNLAFKKSDVTTTSGTALYDKYDVAFPGNCGGGVDTVVAKNISDSDLQLIGTQNGIKVYVLKDANHALYERAYHVKVDLYEDSFKYGNPGVTKPTFSQYVAKHPLLFMKDFWGRWVLVGEYDYIIPGGCGKPVIYLYPKETSEVSVAFETPVEFTHDIPTYGDGWKVMAEPNGLLHELNPLKTDCSAIDSGLVGLEYAKGACERNSYPYLYWSGRVVLNSYPRASGGWYVASSDVAGFVKERLAESALNEKEASDMASFWVPEILKSNAPYFKISFFQTSEMNRFVPMSVGPTPDSVYRLFLDFSPLAGKPSTTIEPQELYRINRHGFTLIEWGGRLVN